MAKEKYISFKMSEEELRRNFLDWVIIGDNTPIDIAYKANIIKVEKVLYPVRNVMCNYLFHYVMWKYLMTLFRTAKKCHSLKAISTQKSK